MSQRCYSDATAHPPSPSSSVFNQQTAPLTEWEAAQCKHAVTKEHMETSYISSALWPSAAAPLHPNQLADPQ